MLKDSGNDFARTLQNHLLVRGHLVGNIVPFVLLFTDMNALIPALAVLAGIYFTEKIWVEAPQRIPLV
ncbi:MAG: hypothetical protein IPN97_12185 [Saprospiraceae bacterium]|nr:hypothetical protein [Saprospiraceae bacterium]